jgi:hypothetical protein
VPRLLERCVLKVSVVPVDEMPLGSVMLPASSVVTPERPPA